MTAEEVKKAEERHARAERLADFIAREFDGNSLEAALTLAMLLAEVIKLSKNPALTWRTTQGAVDKWMELPNIYIETLRGPPKPN